VALAVAAVCAAVVELQGLGRHDDEGPHHAHVLVLDPSDEPLLTWTELASTRG
jgi:hypothetical protein